MKYLFILNDPPYGTERNYNALRLAISLLRTKDDLELTVFLLGDSVLSAKAGQITPNGFYNIERMLKPIVQRGRVLLCGTCMDARGMKPEDVAEGCSRSTMDVLTDTVLEADKTLVF